MDHHLSPPNEFLCPITYEVMSDPVVLCDGYSYERATIATWLRAHNTSPLTGKELEHKRLLANLTLRSAIEAYNTRTTTSTIVEQVTPKKLTHTQIDNNKSERYEGAIRNGKRHGRGKFTWPNGDSYTGEWRDDAMHGTGKFVSVAGDGDGGGFTYEGEFESNRRHGRGVLRWTSGDKYVGDWCAGERTGHGLLIYASGDRFEGAWSADKKHGRGTYWSANGYRYDGVWCHDRRTNDGVWTEIRELSTSGTRLRVLENAAQQIAQLITDATADDYYLLTSDAEHRSSTSSS